MFSVRSPIPEHIFFLSSPPSVFQPLPAWTDKITHLILAPVRPYTLFSKAQYLQVIICLGAGLVLPPMDHENSYSHADDESNGNNTSKDPNNTSWGTLWQWLLCRQEEK